MQTLSGVNGSKKVTKRFWHDKIDQKKEKTTVKTILNKEKKTVPVEKE
ncbi:hypothetical protein [Acetobacterium wieringae]|nr:hypothetical protein [Acetobacterium wieringae]